MSLKTSLAFAITLLLASGAQAQERVRIVNEGGIRGE